MQSLLDVFESHYKREHVDDMMTVVNLIVAEKRNRKSDGTPVCQIPCKHSTGVSDKFMVFMHVATKVQVLRTNMCVCRITDIQQCTNLQRLRLSD